MWLIFTTLSDRCAWSDYCRVFGLVVIVRHYSVTPFVSIRLGWLELAEHLSLFKFEPTRSNLSQVGGQTTPNVDQVQKSGSSWLELGEPFGQGFDVFLALFDNTKFIFTWTVRVPLLLRIPRLSMEKSIYLAVGTEQCSGSQGIWCVIVVATSRSLIIYTPTAA